MNFDTKEMAAYSLASYNVSKTRQVIMLYEGVIKILQQARRAIEDNQVEERFNLLHKAASVIVGLQASLDFERGEKISKLLDDYYYSIDMRIMHLHRNPDIKLLDQVIKELRMMHEAWVEVDLQAREEGEDDPEVHEAAPSPEKVNSISVSI